MRSVCLNAPSLLLPDDHVDSSAEELFGAVYLGACTERSDNLLEEAENAIRQDEPIMLDLYPSHAENIIYLNIYVFISDREPRPMTPKPKPQPSKSENQRPTEFGVPKPTVWL